MRLVLMFVLIGAAASCTKSPEEEDNPPGPPVKTSVKGTISGRPIEFTHVTVSVGYGLEDGTPIDAHFTFSRDKDGCRRSNQGKLVASSDSFSYRLRNYGPDGESLPIRRGTYPRIPPYEGKVSMDGDYVR